MTGANTVKKQEDTPAKKAMKAAGELEAARGIANSIKIAENAPDVNETSALPKIPISDLARAGGKLKSYADQAVPAEVDAYQANVEAPRGNSAIPIDPIVDTTPQPVQPQAAPVQLPEAKKTAVDSAVELASTPPNKVSAVIEKLKQEEKKGGPNLWDILQAAAAGFNGQTPMYIQRKMQAEAEKNDREKEERQNAADMLRMQEAARLQNEELNRRFAEERQARKEDAALQRELLATQLGAKGGLALPRTARLDAAELGVGQ